MLICDLNPSRGVKLLPSPMGEKMDLSSAFVKDAHISIQVCQSFPVDLKNSLFLMCRTP